MRPRVLHRRQKQLLKDALTLTRLGYRVIAVAADKTPLVKGYFGERPYSPSAIRNQPWHKAMYVGIVLRQDEIALDVDVKQAKCGEEHMIVLEGTYGPLPATVQQRTLTGGRHLIFRLGAKAPHAGWRSKVALRDGRDADIDIVHGGYRFLVVYDLSVWLSADQEWPQMPDAWLPALLKTAGRKSVPDQGPDTYRGQPREGLDVRLDEVRRAQEPDRNNTLNRCLFRATVDGHVGSDVGEQFRIAAEAAGLTPTEVDKTISSSVNAGIAARSHVDRWFTAALNHPDLQAPRTRDAYLAVITAVRDVALISPQGLIFGLSVRELAERTGLSAATAAKYLNLLDANDLLQPLPWLEHHHARRYRLKVPRGLARKLDSHPSTVSTSGNVTNTNATQASQTPNEDCGSASTPMIRNSSQTSTMDALIAQVVTHSAFYRSKGRPSFPRSCATLLAALEMGCATKKALTVSTGLHRNTIHDNLVRLERAQVIQKVGDGSFHLVSDTAWQALDRWAKGHDVPGRIEAQRAQHAEERAAFRHHRESGTSTGNPRSSGQREATTLVQGAEERPRVRSRLYPSSQTPEGLRGQMAITQGGLENRLLAAANALRGPIDPADFKNYVFPMLFWKWLSDKWEWEHAHAVAEYGEDVDAEVEDEFHQFAIPDGALWQQVTTRTSNLGAGITKAMGRIEQANPDRLAGIFGDAAWGNKERLPEANLVNLIDVLDGLTLNPDEVSNDLLGAAYEYLLRDFADQSGKKAGEFFTPRSVVNLLVRILDPQPEESVYDPAAGSGGMLVETINTVRRHGGDVRTLHLYGQEVNLTTSGIARMNLLLHDIGTFQIVRGDTLRNPGLRETTGRISKFDVVIANPPFSLKNWGADQWAADPRAFCGIPPKTVGDMAWIQHMVTSMDPDNGRVGVVMPHGVLFRGGAEAKIRKCLIEDDRLEAVIGLPQNLFYSTSIPACLLVFRSRKPAERKGHVLFVDGSARFTKGRNRNEMTPDDIDSILAAYQTSDDPDGEGGTAVRLVPHDEIKTNGWDLNIGRYLSTTTTDEVDLDTALAAYLDARESRIAAEQALLERLNAAGIADLGDGDG